MHQTNTSITEIAEVQKSLLSADIIQCNKVIKRYVGDNLSGCVLDLPSEIITLQV